jgi:hypothetical protein
MVGRGLGDGTDVRVAGSEVEEGVADAANIAVSEGLGVGIEVVLDVTKATDVAVCTSNDSVAVGIRFAVELGCSFDRLSVCIAAQPVRITTNISSPAFSK